MKPRLYLLLALALLGVAGGDSCTAPNEQTFVILHAVPLPLATGMNQGAITCNTNSSQFLSGGILDLKLVRTIGSGYIMCPTVQNNRPSTMIRNGNVESANIVMEGADVDITFGPEVAQAGVTFTDAELHFRQSIYDVLKPGDQIVPAIDLIPPEVALKLAQSSLQSTEADLKITFVGDTNGNTIKSNQMPFTVRICSGCLTRVTGPCCSATANMGYVNPVQDGVIDCCQDATQTVHCPAEVLPGQVCTATDAGP